MNSTYIIPETMAEFAVDLRGMEITDPVAYAQLRPIYEQMLVDVGRGLAHTGTGTVMIERNE